MGLIVDEPEPDYINILRTMGASGGFDMLGRILERVGFL